MVASRAALNRRLLAAGPHPRSDRSHNSPLEDRDRLETAALSEFRQRWGLQRESSQYTEEALYRVQSAHRAAVDASGTRPSISSRDLPEEHALSLAARRATNAESERRVRRFAARFAGVS
jgi:hypothetical protein